MSSWIPRKINVLGKVIFLNIVFLTLLRVIFFGFFYPPQDQIVYVDLLHAFYLGLKFDMRLILIVQLVMLVFPWSRMSSNHPREKRYYIWMGLQLLFLGVIVLFYYFDFGTYFYLSSRLNSSLFRFLQDGMTSARMIWQTYPVVWLFLLLGAILFVYSLILKKWVLACDERSYFFALRPKKQKAFVWVFAIFLWILGGYGKLAFYPLRWSEAFFATNSFVSYLSVNPVLFFFNTLKFGEKNYNEEKVREYYDQVAEYLGVDNPNAKTLDFTRYVYPEAPRVKGTPNVVVIVMESLAAYKTGMFGNKLNATPVVDQLKDESLFFSRFYVPSQATARSIFGVVTGIPDLAKIRTSSRNPLIVHQHSVLNHLEGYEKYYFLGGSANWGNIRGVFGHNIDDINILEEGNYSSPRTDVWGISDYHLFEEANEVFKNKSQEKPFFALVQSSGFHRPYTIPEDHGNFEVESFEGRENLLKHYGFISADEFNSIKFQDYSLGHFFELAKKEPYYENTIFLIFGDHGLPHNNAANVDPTDKAVNLQNFHVPLLIHGPKFFGPEEIKTVASELDVFPTILGMLGKPYANRTLGRDLFDKRFDNNRKAFTYYWYTRPVDFGLLDSEHYYLGNLHGKDQLFKFPNGEVPVKDIQSNAPDKFKEMESLAKGLYYTGRYLLYHNPHIPLAVVKEKAIKNIKSKGLLSDR